MCRKWLMCAAVCLFLGAFGCADVDEGADALRCSQAALLEDWEDWAVESVNFSLSCDGMARDLIGVWDSVNMSDKMRYVIEEGGHYSFWTQRGDRWVQQYEGVFWIEYHPNMGLYRTQMHMSIPDNDDYGVRYHIVDDTLHFEEPSFGLRTLQFRKVG